MSGDVRDARFFDYDPFAGVTEYFHFDPATGGFHIESVQDVEPLIEINKAMSNDAPLRWGEWSHVASTPPVITRELIRLGILGPGGTIRDEPRYRQWLNDRDNQAWRTRPGKL